MDIRVETSKLNIEKSVIEKMHPKAREILDRLWSGNEEMTGWVQAPLKIKEGELRRIQEVADIIKDGAELLVVIGIGGSYLGAKAAIEALPKTSPGIEVRFFGTNFCTDYYRETIEEIKNRQTVLCVISKSGNTTEVRSAFEVLKPIMTQKYGSEEEAARRIFAITDEFAGALRREVEEKGYSSMVIPADVGGRYSVLTPVGLLPIAVSGVDIEELIKGATVMATSPNWDAKGTDYAICRHLLQQKGKQIEVIEMTHSRLVYLGEWIKQLYGESEGKEGQGLFPVTLTLSTDLHSMGQYLQEGRQNFFETVILVDDPEYTVTVPAGQLAGKTIDELNKAMIAGTIKAHTEAGIPVAEVHLPKLSAYHYGQLLYFLETTCAVTAMLNGVNPFNQPGVEEYKAEMRKLLGIC